MSVQLDKSQSLSQAGLFESLSAKHGDKIVVCAAIAIAAIAIIALCHALPIVPCLVIGGLVLFLAALLLSMKDEHKKQTVLVDLETKSIVHESTTTEKTQGSHHQQRQENLAPQGIVIDPIFTVQTN